MIECKLSGQKKCYLQNLAGMKSQSVLSDLFDETVLITDHAYLQLGRFKVIFMPRKHIHL